MSKVRKSSVNSPKVAKRIPRSSSARNYSRHAVDTNDRIARKKYSSILDVETRRERSRTLREYEKQRDVIWAFLEDD